MTVLVYTGPARAKRVLVLAHGAGADMASDFMVHFADALADRKIRVARFNFPYMEARARDGKRRPPDRAPVLMQTWRDVVAEIGAARCLIGGKSMGGRMASALAVELEATGTPVLGAVYLGYPFHAPGKPDTPRLDALRATKTPSLLLQGERDIFGTRDEVPGYRLSRAVKVHWLKDGDHSLVPRKSSGRTKDGNWAEAVDAITTFVTSR